MYETEANTNIESSGQLSQEALSAFGELRGKVLARTVLPWGEHCTECVWPTCYATCDLYQPRRDGRCRRFIDGMVRVDYPPAMNRYLLKIRFKRWAKLWTPGNVTLHPAGKAEQMERRDYRIGSFLCQLPLPAPVTQAAIRKRYSFKKKSAAQYNGRGIEPTGFLFECFNPLRQSVPLSLTIRPSRHAAGAIPFQHLIDVTPGFHRVRIPHHLIQDVIDLRSPFDIELVPNDIGEDITLYFGLIDFVQETLPETGYTRKVKCIVWDLDNTLWDGTLVEDGVSKLQLKPGIPTILETLDRRGILQSVASKNNHADAMDALKTFRIDHFFLYPQISWGPKSAAVHEIARVLNIGIDTLLFVDDSEFELAQVKMACPDTATVHARDYRSIPDRHDCRVSVTSESVARRSMYQTESARQTVANGFKDDYQGFLKHCEIKLTIRTLTPDNLERVHELTQRTNQMNFSGNRYNRDVLESIMGTEFLDTYVLSCEDRFGSYGIIGFGIVDSREPRLTDLMFSCRIQSKRVEHAFLSYLIQKYMVGAGNGFHASYRRTDKNMHSGRVFTDIGMEELAIRDGVTDLMFPQGKEVPRESIIEIVTQ